MPQCLIEEIRYVLFLKQLETLDSTKFPEFSFASQNKMLGLDLKESTPF